MVLNQLANAIVQYTAVNNVLPGSWSNISPIVEDSLRYYIPDKINPARSWDDTTPIGAGQFIDGSGFASDGVAGGGANCMAVVYQLEGQDNILCLEVLDLEWGGRPRRYPTGRATA